MGAESLSFAAIERRIQAMPDGPSAVLNTPRWLAPLNTVGTAGIIVDTLPSVLVYFLTQASWMVVMAYLGLGMEQNGVRITYSSH